MKKLDISQFWPSSHGFSYNNKNIPFPRPGTFDWFPILVAVQAKLKEEEMKNANS